MHLHGALSAKDLWSIGLKKRSRTRLKYFASEYQKAWGKEPDFEKYWLDNHGFESLKKDYEIKSPVNFKKFQASFNLIIALCPILEEDFSIQRQILAKLAAENIEFLEARTVIPLSFKKEQVFTYLCGLCQMLKQANEEFLMQTRFVFSLPRSAPLAKIHYDWISQFKKQVPKLGRLITGFDFAAFEEDCPPSSLKDFFLQFHKDQENLGPLSLTYHIGESFESIGLAQSIAWILEVSRMEINRFGHALALGFEPFELLGSVQKISRAYFLQHLNWLKKEKDLLANSNLFKFEEKRMNRTSDFISIYYDKDYCEELRVFQIAVARVLKEKSVIIETCPTSNEMIISTKRKTITHPLKFFIEQDLDIVLGTDDPGLFKTNLAEEVKKAVSYGLDLKQVQINAKKLISE